MGKNIASFVKPLPQSQSAKASDKNKTTNTKKPQPMNGGFSPEARASFSLFTASSKVSWLTYLSKRFDMSMRLGISFLHFPGPKLEINLEIFSFQRFSG